MLGLLAAMFDGVKQCGIHPRQTGQHHGIASVALPFILVDCPRLSWIGHDHSKTQLLQKAARPRNATPLAGFQPKSLAPSRNPSSTRSPRWFATPTAWDGRSLQPPEAIRSRTNARARLDALSDERLAKDDPSSATAYAGHVIVASFHRAGCPGITALLLLYKRLAPS